MDLARLPRSIRRVGSRLLGVVSPATKTKVLLQLRADGQNRRLEIGPGNQRLHGFETLDITSSRNVDYVWDAATKLPFESRKFALVYASHILEHIPWYQTAEALAEWVRILAPGGWLEVWVPDGLKICKAFVDAESGDDYTARDGWYRFNDDRDPAKWASGRIFSYGDGKGDPSSPNWHRAIFSTRYLKMLFRQQGLEEVRELEAHQVRGYDHGWINLGITGRKP